MQAGINIEFTELCCPLWHLRLYSCYLYICPLTFR